MTPNEIRDKAREAVSDDPAKAAAAIEAWSRVYAAVPHYEGLYANYRRQKIMTAARLAILVSLADGGSVNDAERAGMEALS